ncbi:MAG: alpha/beta hydrolase [Eubacteriales bacterium]|nr:alpha/beta hydrolase [Eubacteriales bacterium]
MRKIFSRGRLLPVILAAVTAAAAAAALIFFGYVSIYYRADVSAKEALKSDETTVVQTDYGWFFDGPSEEAALIFYPGAKVEETAYAPLLHSLATAGMDVCLVKMPFRLALFDIDAAEKVMGIYNYSSWYIGGHSLGGAIAAIYAADHNDIFAGTILFAAYPTKKLSPDMAEILLVGSEDKVVQWKKIEESRQYAPARYTEHVIEGGNHAQFGSYGVQKGDGTAAIPADLQVEESVQTIIEALPELF